MFQGEIPPSGSHFTVYIHVSTGHYDTLVHYVMADRELHQSLYKVVVFTQSELGSGSQEHRLDWNSSDWLQHESAQEKNVSIKSFYIFSVKIRIKSTLVSSFICPAQP